MAGLPPAPRSATPISRRAANANALKESATVAGSRPPLEHATPTATASGDMKGQLAHSGGAPPAPRTRNAHLTASGGRELSEGSRPDSGGLPRTSPDNLAFRPPLKEARRSREPKAARRAPPGSVRQPDLAPPSADRAAIQLDLTGITSRTLGLDNSSAAAAAPAAPTPARPPPGAATAGKQRVAGDAGQAEAQLGAGATSASPSRSHTFEVGPSNRIPRPAHRRHPAAVSRCAAMLTA